MRDMTGREYRKVMKEREEVIEVVVKANEKLERENEELQLRFEASQKKANTVQIILAVVAAIESLVLVLERVL